MRVSSPWIRWGLGVVALLAGSGCATLSTMQSARPADPGEVQLGLSAGLNANAIPGLRAQNIPIPLPVLEAQGRYGVADRMDVGLRVRPIGVLGEMKYMFLETPSICGSFAPGLGWGGIAVPGEESSFALHEVDVHVPVYFGQEIGAKGFFVLGPKLIGRQFFQSISAGELSGLQQRFLLMGGGVAGVSFGLGPHLRFGTELNVYNDFTENTGLAAEANAGLFIDFGGDD